MTKTSFHFKVIIRTPKYPVIVVMENSLYPAFNVKQLAEVFFLNYQNDNDRETIVIDSTGAEFNYISEQKALMPNFLSKRWTKKMIIELFNERLTDEEQATEYPFRSLSNKRILQIVGEICELL